MLDESSCVDEISSVVLCQLSSRWDSCGLYFATFIFLNGRGVINTLTLAIVSMLGNSVEAVHITGHFHWSIGSLHAPILPQ
jgi:hypothetical protein